MTAELHRPVLLVHSEQLQGIGVLTVAGDLTAASAPGLRTHLVDALGSIGPRLIVDLRAVRSGDPSAVAVIDAVSTRAWRRGGWLRLAGVPAQLLAVYAELGRRPTAYPRVQEALAAGP